MILCAQCLHNTGLDDDLVAEVLDDHYRVAPACERNVPAFPQAEQCTHFYAPPMDGEG